MEKIESITQLTFVELDMYYVDLNEEQKKKFWDKFKRGLEVPTITFTLEDWQRVQAEYNIRAGDGTAVFVENGIVTSHSAMIETLPKWVRESSGNVEVLFKQV
jgi:hypothetical protein